MFQIRGVADVVSVERLFPCVQTMLSLCVHVVVGGSPVSLDNVNPLMSTLLHNLITSPKAPPTDTIISERGFQHRSFAIK